MADILNLRRARKAKTRAASEKQSAENRRRFGRSKAERDSTAANILLGDRRLDAHLRQISDEPDNNKD